MYHPICKRAALTALLAGCGCAVAQTDVTFYPPTIDAWVYGLGAGSNSPYAPTFASPLNDPDPDRLGSLGLVFRTSELVNPGEGPWVVESARLYITMINSSTFDPNDGVVYDPTYDSYDTYPPLGTQPDDAGRPIELYGAMPDPGTTLADWVDAGGPISGDGPYSLENFDFDGTGTPRVVTNNVDEGYDTNPFAVGVALSTYVAGDGTTRIADGSDVYFDIDVNDPHIQAWLSQGLSEGYIGLMVSSLHGAFYEIEGGGGLGQIYPRWATDETFGLFPAQLDVTIRPADTCVADVNTKNVNPGDPGYGEPDGTVDGADLSYFVENWLGQNASVADVNTKNVNPGDPGYGEPDGVVDGADLSYFVEKWLTGCAS